jgi:phospholipase C
VISPFARPNFVDHTITDQTSVLKFIEDNWLHRQRIGQGSFDDFASSITQMLDFHAPSNGPLFLDPSTGEPR